MRQEGSLRFCCQRRQIISSKPACTPLTVAKMTTEHVRENVPKMLSQFSGIVKVRQAGINGSSFSLRIRQFIHVYKQILTFFDYNLIIIYIRAANLCWRRKMVWDNISVLLDIESGKLLDLIFLNSTTGWAQANMSLTNCQTYYIWA